MQNLQFHDQTQSCTNTTAIIILTLCLVTYISTKSPWKPLIAKGYLEGLKLGLTWQNL